MPSMSRIHCVAFAVFLILCSAAAGSEPRAWVHHDLRITLSPEEHRLQAADKVTLPAAFRAGRSRIAFMLHKDLAVACETAGLELAASGGPQDVLVRYELRAAEGQALPETAALAYHGSIHHPIEQTGEEYARAFSETPGLISAEGVYLAPSSGWYPVLDGELVTFDLEVSLPEGWEAVSQGGRIRREVAGGRNAVVWSCPDPQDGMYLSAGRFTEYTRECGGVTAFAFLRNPDAALASQYLQATETYIDTYSRLIGPYAYDKFALVENFWETGYGMPSFTLLGPKVIRFPFILRSSYPHEILHNWWGNGVFVAPGSGNWCEGLTAYLADHLIKEQQGLGAEHRRSVLQKYADYVRHAGDFALEDFRSRHDAVTEAVGYGKCLMLFHMLRCRIGDEAFKKGLRAFYEEKLFEYATFEDLESAFSTASGTDLSAFFRQWVKRAGAPQFAIADGGAYPLEDGGYRFILFIDQRQDQEPFDLQVPLAVHMEGRKQAEIFAINTNSRRFKVEIDLPGKPLRIELDPRFEVFRRLDPNEIPPSIGRMFGADKVLIVLPSSAPENMAAAWKELAAAWSSEKVAVAVDSELDALPADAAVWIFGRDNRFCPAQHRDLEALSLAIGPETVRIPAEGRDIEYPLAGRAFAIALRHSRSNSLPMCWVGASVPGSLAGLARKLPHYGKYSYLVFEGEEPANVAKGQWPVLQNPLVVNLAREGAPGSEVPRREPLVAAEPRVSADDLGRRAAFLSDDRLEGRGLGTAGLDTAGEYIAEGFAAAGLQPAGDGGTFFQTWTDANGPGGTAVQLKNVLARLPGADPDLPLLVVGAHYDHLGRGWPDVRDGCQGQIHNGADDNASGVAVVLEAAQVLMNEGFKPQRPVIFAAFTGEEAGLRGSAHFAAGLGAGLPQAVFAMINVDSVGRLEGRKLQVLGTGTAKEWPHIVMGIGYTAGVEADAVPADPGGGDQVTFTIAGVPAVHIFGGLHADYHRPTDDADKLDISGMADAAVLLIEMVRYLGERVEPLQPAGGERPPHAAARDPAGSGRSVSLGTMPDFAFPGPGVRIAQVMPGTPAAEAGLSPGDIITRIDQDAIADLKAMSEALKRRAPGDEVTVEFTRNGATGSVRARLQAR